MVKKRRRRKPGPVAGNKSEIVASLPLACSNERAAVEFMERQRWGNTPACPRCGDTDVAQMRAATGERNKRWLWRCYGCKQQFTVRLATIMEDSPIPIRHWCYAFWAACSSKKGVSALQIQRMTGVSYKSALFMMHRIRWALAGPGGDGGQLVGIVEVDETYAGGKRKRSGKPGRPNPRERTPVLALVQRDGPMRGRVVPDVTAATLKGAIREHVHPSSRIMTDEYQPYRGIGREFDGGHHTVTHTQGEYGRGDIHTNTVEGFFALLKRGLTGTFHAVSKKHLHRYVGEFEFR